MDPIMILGFVAAAVSSLSGLPQLAKTLKTKSAKDLSLGMFSVIATGAFLWLTYGILIEDIPLIAANIVTLAIVVPILILKIKYK